MCRLAGSDTDLRAPVRFGGLDVSAVIDPDDDQRRADDRFFGSLDQSQLFYKPKMLLLDPITLMGGSVTAVILA